MDVMLFDVEIDVEIIQGGVVIGFGLMLFGNVWVWFFEVVGVDEFLQVMLEFVWELVCCVNELKCLGYLIDFVYELVVDFGFIVSLVCDNCCFVELMLRLVQLVVVSLIDVVLYDVYGCVYDCNVYDLFLVDFVYGDLSVYLNDDFKGEFFDCYMICQFCLEMLFYYLVGVLDLVCEDEFIELVGDGFFEIFVDWMCYDGLMYLKIKFLGEDMEWDVVRVFVVEEVVSVVVVECGKEL